MKKNKFTGDNGLATHNQEKLFEKMYEAWKKKKETGITTNPLIPKEMDEFYNRLAKATGIKRGSDEWNRFVWVNMCGVSPDTYDASMNKK